MRVLVVGGCGYIGARLVPLLQSVGHEVTVLDPKMFGSGDVKARAFSLDEFKDKDTVLWLASISNNAVHERHPWLTTVVNRDMVECAAIQSICCGVQHFIYASSVAAYGNVENADEDTPLNPTTQYGSAKRWCERMLSGQANKLCWTVVRAASVFGHSPNMRFDTPINAMVRSALTTGTVRVNGGAQKRCHVYIDDLCYLYQLIVTCRKDIVTHAVFNGVGAVETIAETAETVARVCNAEITRFPAADDRSYGVSWEKTKRALQWYPQTDIETGIAAMKTHRDKQYDDNDSARERRI